MTKPDAIDVVESKCSRCRYQGDVLVVGRTHLAEHLECPNCGEEWWQPLDISYGVGKHGEDR